MLRAVAGAGFVLVLVSPFPLAAQLPDSVRRQVDSVFSDYDHTTTPGCALAIYRDGEIVFARGYGMANLELRIAISPGTVFDIGSTSKQFAAFAIGLLAQDGRLSLDDPIRKHLPEMGAYADQITIRNLVQHTSGLRDYLTLMSLAGFNFDDVTDDQDALKLITRQKAANFAPNSEWLYSNSGYFLLSQIVKRSSGKSLREFAAERIFGPLGMQATHFHDDHTMIVPDRATGYSRQRAGYRIEMSNFEQTGDGAVYTTVEELLLWDRNWYSGRVGGTELLTRQQETGQIASGRDHGYAGGLMIGTQGGLRTVRHGGAWAGYRAELLRFPDQRTAIACLCNRADADPSARADKVAGIVLAGKLATAPLVAGTNGASGGPLSDAQMAALAGTWRSPVSGDLRFLEVRGGKLYPRGSGAEVRAQAADRFVWGPFTAILDGSGGSLRFEREGRSPETYQKLPPVSPNAGSLEAYAGTWYSEELVAFWRLIPSDSGLRIEIRDRPSGTLRQVAPDLFSDGGRHVEFTRSKGKPTGFTVSAGRVRGISFTRSGM